IGIIRRGSQKLLTSSPPLEWRAFLNNRKPWLNLISGAEFDKLYPHRKYLLPPQFVTVAREDHILRSNLLRSELFKKHALTVQKGNTNIAQAFNEAPLQSDRCVCWIQESVFLPPDFEAQLNAAFASLDMLDMNWGVLGVAGAKWRRGKL